MDDSKKAYLHANVSLLREWWTAAKREQAHGVVYNIGRPNAFAQVRDDLHDGPCLEFPATGGVVRSDDDLEQYIDELIASVAA